MKYWGLLVRTETGKGLLADLVISRERYAEETSDGCRLHYTWLPTSARLVRLQAEAQVSDLGVTWARDAQ